MALITCPECGCEISHIAETCPHCGCPTALFPELERATRLKTTYALREDDRFSLGVWGGRSVRWRVLKAEGNLICAISEKGLDCQPFNHSKEKGNDWDSSDLKAWLEQEFLERAFTRGERALILDVTCLSVDEVEELFEDDEERSCKPTAYAEGRGVFVNPDSGGCEWWLRSAGKLGAEFAAYAFEDGMLDEYGTSVDDSMTAVRPALRLQLPTRGLPALLNICPVCGSRISKHTKQCPDCGCPRSDFPREVGNRFQMGSWDGEDLEWRTLKMDGDRILAVSSVGVTCRPFNYSRYGSNDWNSSDLCEWLNESFPYLAFNYVERERISEVTCLSVYEVKELFEDDTDRICPPTADASRQGVTVGRMTGGCDWWLRSGGRGGSDQATFVNFAGYVGEYGCHMDHTNVAVRPAVWLKL